jgi:phospholipid transport system substrate-binding protein
VVQKYLKVLASPKSSDPVQKIEEVRQYFDFEGLAQDSTGQHWAKMTKDQRKEFVAVFSQLVEAQHLRKGYRATVTTVQCGKEEIEKTKAKVACVIPQTPADVDSLYELRLEANRWLIRNFVLDGVDVRKNYETMLGYNLRYLPFEKVLEKMKLNLVDAQKQ